MNNSITLFLLFTYSFILGLTAFIYLSSVKKKKKTAENAIKDKNQRFKRSHNLLEKLTDPLFNAQYEISKKIKQTQKASGAGIDAITSDGPANDSNIINVHDNIDFNNFSNNNNNNDIDITESSRQNGGTNIANINKNDNELSKISIEEQHYEIDSKTLQLLINTFAYDDFAKIYEKFLNAHSESEICRLIEELEDFREDDRLLMILTPLLSHESVRVQSAVNGFITKTEKAFITEEMVNIIENSEYIDAVQSINAQNEFKPSRCEGSPFTSPDSISPYFNDAENYESALNIDKSVFFEPPHKLVLEAYATNDRDRLFAISCALAQYDDPLIVDAMLYIDSRLNGEINGYNEPGSAVIKNGMPINNVFNGKTINNNESSVIKSQPAVHDIPEVQKFNFMNIDDIFKHEAPESKLKFKELSGVVANLKTEQRRVSTTKENSKTNDYVKGIKLVNIAKFARYEECSKEITDALNHDNSYVKCCAINAVKVLARRSYQNGELERFDELRKILMSHEIFEKNVEVAALCSKAITEIESYSMSVPDAAEIGEMQNSYAMQLTQADGIINMAKNSRQENENRTENENENKNAVNY